MSSIIDTRDLAGEMDELRAEEPCPDCDGEGYLNNDEEDGLVTCGNCKGECTVEGPLDEEDKRRLQAIEELESSVYEFHDGATLIREDEFEDYARGLAEDIGAIPSEHTWPTSCIDWKQAAWELKMDYTSVEFAGDTYYTHQ